MTEGSARILDSEITEFRCQDCVWSSNGVHYSHMHPVPGENNGKPVEHEHGPVDVLMERFPEYGESPDPGEHSRRARHVVYERRVTLTRIEPTPDG